MNPLQLINKFWQLHEEHSFNVTEIALFFHLWKINNQCFWKESFRRNNSKIEADLRISFNTMKNARNKLQQCGVITFTTRNGSPDVVYRITLSNSDEVPIEVPIEVVNEVVTKVSSEVSSTKIKQRQQTKTKPKPVSKSHSKTEVSVIEKIENLKIEPKPENEIYKKLVAVWFDFYQKNYNTKPTFRALEGGKIKSIEKKLKSKCEEFQQDWTEERAGDLFRKFLEVASNDKWLKNNFQLQILDSKFDIIIVKSLKNKELLTDISINTLLNNW